MYANDMSVAGGAAAGVIGLTPIIAFADGADQQASFNITVPKDKVRGTAGVIKAVFANTTAGFGNVALYYDILMAGKGSNLGGVAVRAWDISPGSGVNIKTISNGVAVSGSLIDILMVDDASINIRIGRNATLAADTADGAVINLIKAILEYTALV